MNYRTLIIDGNYLARSRFEGTGEIERPFMDVVEYLCEEWDPAIVGVAWDPPPGSRLLRSEISPDYKANRGAKPDGFSVQLGDLQEKLPSCGIAQYYGKAHNGAWGEGDDVLATVARSFIPVTLIWTADKDMLQLVSDSAHMIKAGVGGRPSKLCRPDTIVAETGLSAKGWRDYLILAGDRVDNVPGLSKVGDGRARSILKACPDFVDLVLGGDDSVARREVLAQDASLGKWVERAISERENLELTRKLIELQDVELIIIDAGINKQLKKMV